MTAVEIGPTKLVAHLESDEDPVEMQESYPFLAQEEVGWPSHLSLLYLNFCTFLEKHFGFRGLLVPIQWRHLMARQAGLP